MIILRKYIRTLLESQQAKQYIRFGLWPKNERSKRGKMASTDEDWEDFEEGVSVYDTFWNDKVSKWEIHEGNMSVTAVTLGNFIGRFKRGTTPAFLVTGDVIGVGLDGEPLLHNVKKIKELKCEEIYVPELDFGSPYSSEEDCGIEPKEKIYNAIIKLVYKNGLSFGKHQVIGFSFEIINKLEKEIKEDYGLTLSDFHFVGTKKDASRHWGQAEKKYYVYKSTKEKDEYPSGAYRFVDSIESEYKLKLPTLTPSSKSSQSSSAEAIVPRLDSKEEIYSVKIFHNDKIRYGEESGEEVAGYESEILNMIEKEMGGQIEFVGTKQGNYFYRIKGKKYGPTVKFMTNVGSLAISNKELPI